MDIDIDCQSTFKPNHIFPMCVKASTVRDDKLVPHPVGVYFQSIPVDEMTSLAAIPYQSAEEMGYTKIDFLHLNALDIFESKKEIQQLLKLEPDWTLLQSEDSVKKLMHIKNHIDLLRKVKPTSVEELADCMALIRPGKRKLLSLYLKNRDLARKTLYKKTDQYYFKRSHAISYSLTIVLQLHLIKGGII